MTYYSFLYNFCYKPFLADEYMFSGIDYKRYKFDYKTKSSIEFYVKNNKLYHNRIFLFLQERCLNDIKVRLESHFDNLFIDEIQDIAGRDFNFLIEISKIKINLCYVGDFYQHTFDTSNDGNVNKTLFDNYNNIFYRNGFECDTTSLSVSHRCAKNVCNFIKNSLGINIVNSNKNISGDVIFLDEINKIKNIWNDNNIVKLHYNNSDKFGQNHFNWGEVKGVDCYKDVCIILNKSTVKHIDDLSKLSNQTKNKLYVAITRSRNNVYFINDMFLDRL